MQGTQVRQRKQRDTRDTRDTGIADKCKGRGEIRQIQTNSAETPRGRETRKRERKKERKKEKERERKERRQEDGKNRQERERQSEKAFTGEKQTGTVSKESRHEKTRKKIRKKIRENRRRQYSEKPAGKAARQTEKFSLRNAQRAQGMLQVVFAPASDGGGHRRT